jgi:hypothetical protein
MKEGATKVSIEGRAEWRAIKYDQNRVITLGNHPERPFMRPSCKDH